jgi:hypothetical protein
LAVDLPDHNKGDDHMYTRENFPTKAALKRAVAAGQRVTVFAPGLGTPKRDGTEYVEGPHAPKPHTWYAQVTMKDGKIIAVR